jgi:hypothetical protein
MSPDQQFAPYRDNNGRPRYPIAPGLRDAVLALLPGRPGAVETVGYVAAILRASRASGGAADRDRLRALRVKAEEILAALGTDLYGIGIARGIAEHRAGQGALDDAARLLADAIGAAEACVAEKVTPGRATGSLPRQAVTLLASAVLAHDGDADLLAALAWIALEAAGAGEKGGSAAHLRREAVYALRRERVHTRSAAP